jgi:uncharacterized protein
MNEQSAVMTFNVAIPMRDGTVLRADVFRPASDAPVPVLLIRNPYPSFVPRGSLDHFRAVEAGFAVVSQSVRGTGRSEGVFDPWLWELVDGVDSVAWCAAQPWASGRVGTYGPSYLGHTQLYAAGGAPPALAVMAPGVVPSAPYDLTYNGGALLLASTLNWALMQALGRMMRAQAMGEDVGTDLAEWAAVTADHWALCRHAPLRDIPILQRQFPAWQQWLDHPTNDDWWNALDIQDRPSIPSYFTSGWWDLFLRGSLDEYKREPRHPQSRLVIGPWSHINAGSAHGEVYYGPSSSSAAQDIEGQRLDFLSRYLMPGRDEPSGAPVRIFVMGRNQWRDEEAWPLARANDTRFFLHADGSLSPHPPATDAMPRTFVFDPLDPAPTVGGRNLVPGGEGGYLIGPIDQRMTDARTDILRFTTDPLPADLEVTGELTVTLHATTNAIDTDWTAALIDVWPDGRAFNVADGIIRARHRSGTDRVEFLPAGVPHRFEIDLAATSQVFLAGHRIRVDISSSNFPRFDRNPGTGALSTDVDESAFITAQQTLFVDAQRASFITLPLIENGNAWR